MEGLATLIVVVAVFVANLPALREQWRSDRAGFIKTIWLLGRLFSLYRARDRDSASSSGRLRAQAATARRLLLTGFVLGFVLYGGLTLMRVVPRYREPPAWLMHFGIADIVLLGATLACLAAYLRA